MKKIDIYLAITLQSIIYLWIILFFLFPFMSDEYTYKNTHMYVYQKETTGLELKYLKAVDDYLRKYPLYDENISTDIYVVNSDWMYILLSPADIISGWESFANTIIGSNIFIRKVDFRKNKSYLGSREENLDAILAHEMTHVYQMKKYGWFPFMFKTPTWVKEGYAMYSSRDLYIDNPKEVLQDFIANYPHMKSNHISPQYKVWMLMIKHAIEKMHKSVDDLHVGKVSYDEVLDSLLQEYNITKESK